MNNKDIFKYGEEILNRINRASESGDFSHLSRDIKSTVSNATYDIGSEIRDAIENGVRSVFSGRGDNRTPFFSTRVDKKLGVGKIVAGGIITGYGTLGFLANLIVMAVGVSSLPLFITLALVDAIVLSIGIGLLGAGINNRNLIKNYFNFGNIIGKRPYITFRELADKTGIPTNDVLRQIKQMKKRGFLPNAAIDNAETTLMLTDEVYSQYTRSIEYNEQKKKEEQSVAKEILKAKEANKIDYYTIDEDLPKDVQDILKEGNDYLNKIRHYNDLIPDTEEMSDKLYTLEATVLSIFKKLKEEPKVAGDLRKFMSYYLPTTEKLLQSYVDLRNENLDVENIKNSQREIEEATDVINDAFVKLLNQLFENSAWDISSDISVMKTMMKQDSLL